MHHHPTFSRVDHFAILTNETAATTLIINFWRIEGHIDGVCGGVVVWPEVWLFIGSIPNHEVHRRPGWLMEVSHKHNLLQGSHIEVEHIQPLLIIPDLVHVNVPGGNGLVAALQPLVAVGSVAPAAVVLRFVDEFVTEPLREYGEPENVGTGLFDGGIFGERLAVVDVEIAFLPVPPVSLDLPKVVVFVGGWELFVVDEMAEVDPVGDVDEDIVHPEILGEGHVGVEEIPDVGGASNFVVNETSSDEVAGADKGDVPETTTIVVDNIHVVLRSGVEAVGCQHPPEVAPS